MEASSVNNHIEQRYSAYVSRTTSGTAQREPPSSGGTRHDQGGLINNERVKGLIAVITDRVRSCNRKQKDVWMVDIELVYGGMMFRVAREERGRVGKVNRVRVRDGRRPSVETRERTSRCCAGARERRGQVRGGGERAVRNVSVGRGLREGGRISGEKG